MMHTNRLINEKSPYLLQHAHNPVDWHPWGEEAFAKSRAEDKPIFLSIGYSTCHWCHVMERESFESSEIADILNRFFVPIKLDREERPDIDRVYMLFVQATTGSGGWPMSVWLTPDLKPFFGGTYFPPDNRYGRPGFRSVLEQIANAWLNSRPQIMQSSEEILRQLDQVSGGDRAGLLDQGVLDSGFHAFRRGFDSRLGGFGGAPKFPRPVALNFLLRYDHMTGRDEARDMVLLTLREMAKGGMYDQLGGGFHRYSVDDRWFVPHFEKMLYDQAQLAVSYLEAFQITREQQYADIARDVFEYVLRDMTHTGGAFYSAEDADSVIDPAKPGEKGEGAFYIWSKSEIDSVLGEPASEWFCYRYGVQDDGNVGSDPHGEFTGRNILFQAATVEETARRVGVTADEVQLAFATARGKLLAERDKRVRPHLDDKILTAWNGLMISAFATGARVLDDSRYLEAARRAAEFVLSEMYRADSNTLLRRYRDGDAAIGGFLDDYAFFIQGLLDLYEAGFDLAHLETAVRLAERMIATFEDTERGAFYSSAAGNDDLVMRIKDDYDGAEPSGNSVAALVLLRLARMTGRADFGDSAERALKSFGGRLAAQPVATPQMLVAYMYSVSKPMQIVVAGERGAADTRALLRKTRETFLPNAVTLLADSNETRARLGAWQPALGAMTPAGGNAAVYVCENYACQLPVSGEAELAELLQ